MNSKMLGLSIAAVLLSAAMGCTTLIAGKNATKDGSVLASHSDDGESGADARIVLASAKDHAAGSMRDIFYDTEDYPRHVGKDRGIPAYYPVGNQTLSTPIGQIPEVAHTYQVQFSSSYLVAADHALPRSAHAMFSSCALI
jgi:dipeptidase